ncbi:MAG: glycosyltransferase [Lentisphaerae bacterium]|nr:glycosyltransferase [Lentisphaerota bacterium]MBT4821532.1 glycosyltransferase [Lentisphaerota bacterium]MBT5606958.1 glycosyltransferase [Lentisphaerota bacterium]MBT7055111.1 glycosyltransferase [Lentisphaerota bacterium]MBT7842225.1 glycosyltransferase [Lentisphaerota bacterium]
MTTSPAITVLLPILNAEDTLPAAAGSILEQTATDFELLAINDGSTDGTGELLAGLARGDSRVRVLTHERCQGIVAALNDGLAVAQGRYIARMDADDISAPERLAFQLAALDGAPDLGMVGTRVTFGGDRETHAGYALYVDWTNSLLAPEAISLNRFVESPFAHPSVMFRRGLVDQFGGYRDGEFPEDYELWLRWLDAGVRMAKLPETLLTWSDPPSRLSRVDQRYSFEAFYRCKAEYLAKWLARHNPHHPDLVVWGGGRATRKRAEHLCRHGVRICAYVDVDPRRIGQVIHGRPVLDEGAIPSADACFVASFVGSRGARDDIRGRLLSRGFSEGLNFIMAA